MKKGLKISRKDFFRLTGLILLFPFYLIWHISVKNHKLLQNLNKEIKIPADISAGIHFLDQVIVIKENDRLSIFSSRCTHLGCRIKHMENNKLICPCHGSVFDLNGTCLKGPAKKSLESYNYSRTSDGKSIIIQLT